MIENNEKNESKPKESDSFTLKKMIKARTILLTGEINKDLAHKTISELLIFCEDDDKKAIKVFIDSPGGDLYAGFAIFDMFRFVNPPIYTIGMGLVASAAALILLASPKERRIALPNSAYLLHQPLISGVIRGVSSDIEIHAIEIEKSRKKLNEIIAQETEKSVDELKEHTERDYWLNAKEALNYKLVSKVILKQTELDEIIKK